MPDAPVAAIVFYRALAQAGNTGVIDGLIAALRAEGMNALPVFAAGLKDEVAAEIVHALLLDGKPDIVLNTTGFALSNPEGESPTPSDDCPGPVLQAVLAGTTRNVEAGLNGLSARDIAMNVALLEVDGRVRPRRFVQGPSRRTTRRSATSSSRIRARPPDLYGQARRQLVRLRNRSRGSPLGHRARQLPESTGGWATASVSTPWPGRSRFCARSSKPVTILKTSPETATR